MVRINTRVRSDQHKFIKSLAKKSNITEGDLVRLMIDRYMTIDNVLGTKIS